MQTADRKQMRRARAAELRLGIYRHIALIVDEHTLDKRAVISENTVNVLAKARAKLTCLVFKSVKREELIVLRGSVKYRFRIVCPENKHNVLIYRVSLWIYLFGIHERDNAILAGKIRLKIANEKGICVLTTERALFTCCGILYDNGLRGA